jgi:hypothetical protein
MPTSYIPSRDGDYLTWLTNYVAYVTANGPSLGLTAGQVTAAGAALIDYQDGLNAAATAKAGAKAAVDGKDQARDLSEVLVRAQVREIQAHPGITDAQRMALGITVPDHTRTPSAPPTERADVNVVTVGQEHRLTVLDQSNNRAKRPDDARGIELYRAVAAAGAPIPSSIDDMTLVGVFSTSRFSLFYEGDQIGKTVAYIARYVGTKNQPGPVGTLATATIAA